MNILRCSNLRVATYSRFASTAMPECWSFLAMHLHLNEMYFIEFGTHTKITYEFMLICAYNFLEQSTENTRNKAIARKHTF